MSKSLLFLIFFLCTTFYTMGQTDPLYAQYLNNTLLINPAYTGLNNHFTASATFRKQWAGFDGSPTTLNVNGHTSLFDNKMGVGLIILKDQIGADKNTEVHATYAYKIDLDDKYFSFGLQAGIVNFKTDSEDLLKYHTNDPVFQESINTTKANFGAGAILHSDRYFIGLSMPRMLKSKSPFSDTTSLYMRHIYIMGAYTIFLNEHIRFKPSVLFKGVKGAKPSADLNMAFNLNEKYTAGVFTRNFNTYGLLAQMKIGNMYRFGYTFEVPTNKSVGARFTSHEFMFGINLALLRFHDSLAITNW